MTGPGISAFNPAEVLSALVRARVGGDFWSAPVDLAPGCEIVLVPDSPLQLASMVDQLQNRRATVVMASGAQAKGGLATLAGEFDPWYLAAQASEVWAGEKQELATVAALLNKPVKIFSQNQPLDQPPDLVESLLKALAAQSYSSPFSGEVWDLPQVIEQLGEWRRLIESNRDFKAIFGVARWKRVTVDPLLWDGTKSVPHSTHVAPALNSGDKVAAWKSRTPPKAIEALQKRNIEIAEIEDGFIRSVGLGANCVPPLSVFSDRSGIYFDPNQPSDLELMLECDELPRQWVKRAQVLRATLVQAGISKYGQNVVTAPSICTEHRRVLVTGQVEDDRSVLSGGGNCTNLQLIVRTRALEPDAWIVYKPHPDVEAGHRKGHVSDTEVLRYADSIEREASIAALIDQVDALHVITSLAGFEGLLRGKSVTTHGQPFYAGWGLTRDLGPTNPRRTRKRSLDELVAATLIGYPRYVDPVTRLPCPPEVLVQRVIAGQARVTSLLIRLREWQGKLRLVWQALTGQRK